MGNEILIPGVGKVKLDAEVDRNTEAVLNALASVVSELRGVQNGLREVTAYLDTLLRLECNQVSRSDVKSRFRKLDEMVAEAAAKAAEEEQRNGDGSSTDGDN